MVKKIEGSESFAPWPAFACSLGVDVGGLGGVRALGFRGFGVWCLGFKFRGLVF